MQTEQIVALLVAERDRLQLAIDALQSGGESAPTATSNENVPDWVKPGTAVAAPAPKRTMSAAGRKSQADKMRAFWAARREQKSAPVKSKKVAAAQTSHSERMKAVWADKSAAAAGKALAHKLGVKP